MCADDDDVMLNNLGAVVPREDQVLERFLLAWRNIIIRTEGSIVNPSVLWDVFLGGVCGATTWRQDIAIPMLEAAGISYYDPQVHVGQFMSAMIEAEAKERARHILVVITGGARGSASIMEATEHALLGRRNLHLVVDDILAGTVVEGVPVVGPDLNDANRARAYLRSVIRRRCPDVLIHSTVADAVRAIVASYDAEG